MGLNKDFCLEKDLKLTECLHMRISKTFLNTLKLPPVGDDGKCRQKFYRDSLTLGFGVRVTSGGAISFIVEKRINGKVRRKTLGRYGTITLEQARDLAIQFIGQIAGGKDPIAEKKARDIKSITLEEAFDDYLLARKGLRPTTIHDYRRTIDNYLKDWKRKQLTSITKDMVELRHRQLGERSHARANNTMRVLRAVFNYSQSKYEDAKGRPIIQINPVDRLNQTRAWYRIKRKETLIRPHQLADWYKATLLLNQETTRDYLYFVLMTGLRRSEASKLKWSDVDLVGRMFTIKETKNHQTHSLPLSVFLHNLLNRRQQEAETKYVFPSSSERGYLTEPKNAVSRVAELSGVPFTLHDLRRTFITIAESLDIPAYALKRLLNHKDPNDVTAGYIVSDAERLRDPMQRITDFILDSMGIDNDTYAWA